MLRQLQSNLAWGREIGDVVRRLNDYWTLMPRTVWAIEQQRRALPEHLRTLVLDLAFWGITEAELRTRAPQEGPNP